MSRDFIKLRATTEREQLLNRIKDETGIEEDAGAIDEAMRRALSFGELMEQRRNEVVNLAKESRTEFHEIGVRTDVRER